jgi:hypothetical protein
MKSAMIGLGIYLMTLGLSSAAPLEEWSHQGFEGQVKNDAKEIRVY